MPIPPLNEDGLLPPGIHDCSWQELGERFGTFHSTDRRPRLYEKLQEYLIQVRSTGLVVAVIVNGSFVSSKPDPGDIDLILVLSSNQAPRADLPPMVYNVVSERLVRRRYGFDVLVAREEAREYGRYVEFFQQVRGQPHLRKGVLRIRP